MVSKVQNQKTRSMFKNLQLLHHSITHFQRRQKTLVLLDASEYIKFLKQRLEEEWKQLVAAATMPMLKVEVQEEKFMIKVVSERSCKGLLVFILEAFEELGLDVLQARVSCAQNFSLEAIGIKDKNGTCHLDAQVIQKVVSQAIQNWSEVTHQQ
ncbi:hypothetical protein HN51_000518 [Arachis hypogaea]|uniref:Plant bHLH transcription factor ACT-like domain-containing protein n=2 Tax=Arachis TaxID=3817 RepID=A0A445EVN3_ARAHY|nr:uncharacterized protein LOC107475150 [Arachis duranensis]XP_025606725.1 uncharacterized protein LOC112697408 [Arachis hypogaea]QHO48452.1 uncharacterized protein DS421_1g05500 [Arachis hypogaea]RYR79476.1 hypothetical protein Ahy_A01g004292 [Arachis hypogaea]